MCLVCVFIFYWCVLSQSKVRFALKFILSLSVFPHLLERSSSIYTHSLKFFPQAVCVSCNVCRPARAYITYRVYCINIIIDLFFFPKRSSESHRAKLWQGLSCSGLIIFCSGSIKLSGLLVLLLISVSLSHAPAVFHLPLSPLFSHCCHCEICVCSLL